MMGRQPKVQKKMFYTKFNLDRRIRQDHILRKIDDHVNFDFIYNQVKDTYGSKGNVSVPPPVILKMMLLLILYNVRSERELMATIDNVIRADAKVEGFEVYLRNRYAGLLGLEVKDLAS